VILLDNGVVAATGTHDELLATNLRYAAILADTAGADTEQGDA
jgi:ABC-type multidrug transport system fused ATPase/permease subunit